MARIRMLNENVIGKIAAGEVVERPAAAIKELVENSLDAEAKNISVEIRDGGIESFRVTDDGCGIDESDIRMAFERHATSKISSEADLNAIGTLGFRGEALASIAAVARVTMTTRTRERETGIRIKNEGGMITDLSETACAPGTSILVRDLFFNVPVRKGFLKKTGTEANAVTDLMIRLILSRPDVSFRYISNGKMIYHSVGDGKIESSILAIYGSSVIRNMRKVDGNQNGILLKGYIGVGENARNNRNGESFFINGRMLRSPLLSSSLEDAAKERVMIGKFPICALYLEMPYENVNVNVHPNKMEVRFRYDQMVRDAVYTLVKEALRDRDAFQRPVEMSLHSHNFRQLDSFQETDFPWTNEPKRTNGKAEVETGTFVPGIQMMEASLTPVYRPIEGKRSLAVPAVNMEPDLLPPLRTCKEEKTGNPISHESQIVKDQCSSGQKETAGTAPEHGNNMNPVIPFHNEKQNNNIFQAEQAEQISGLKEAFAVPMKIYGALFDTFILIEYADHLLLVDQHAVHERLLYERMMKAYHEQRAGQEMLVPYIVPVTGKDMSILNEYHDLLEELGLVAEPFSQNEVSVRSVPVILGQNETAEFLHEAIDELENGKTPGAEKKRSAILQMACKHAVKGGEPLTEDILRSLVEEMIEKKVTPTCPHGRPLVVSISHAELDKKFKRIQ